MFVFLLYFFQQTADDIQIMSKNNNNQIDLFNEITSELTVFYSAIVQKTDNPIFQSQALKRKNISQLSNKIYKLLNDKEGNAKEAHQNRDIFLKIVESHLTNFANNHVIIHLIRCTEDYAFAEVLARRWRDFKRILFSFFALFIHVKEYYEIVRVTEFNKNKSQYNRQMSDTLPLPIPAIGVKLFTTLVLKRFQIRIKRSVLALLKRQRQLCEPSNNDLRVIFEIVWSCSLRQLARITIGKEQVYFLKEEKKEFMNVFPQAANNEEFIKTYILNDVANIAVHHYAELSNSLKKLNGLQQIQMINIKCELQEDIARFHLPSKASINTYLTAIYRQLILTDFDHILKKQQGFKHIISHFSHNSNEFEKEVIAYFRVIKRVEDAIIDQVIKVIDEVIAQRGAQIREKLNKPREFMIEMLHFKKSLRKIFAIVETNTLKVEVAMEKGFKNLMDGYEVSKSLADFTDFTIRQCIRLKLDESSCEQKMKEVMFMLTSVSAKDLFLAYHQEAMVKRLLDCLSQAKYEPQLQLLRLLADNLGSIMMSQHFSMIKDVQNSIEITDHLSQLLPFVNYKWELRVINSSAWPESALKIRFSHIQPPQMLRVHLYQLQDLYKQYRGFTLQWKLDRGTSLFQGKFARGKWRFQAQNMYLIILLHLNQQPNFQITFSRLSQLINSQKKDTEVNHLQNCLKVLLENRLIVRLQGESADFDPSDIFAVNMQYTPTEAIKPGQTIFVKMSQQLAKTLNQNNVEINKVLKDRQRLVDALLVKLLKHAHATGSNRITFLELYQGIKTNPFLSNFNFTQTAVKERLQQLISKEYCRRDEQDRRIYHYIA